MRSLFLALALWMAVSVSAGPGAASSREAEVLRVQQRRFAAMIRADSAALAPILAEDLTYIHSNGAVDTKKSLLAALTAGTLRYRTITPREVRVRRYGNTAVVIGRARLAVQAADRELAFDVRFTEVYVRHRGRWQMAAWQSTRLPENP